ncbi:MAG: glucose-1-phosphate adenylyltransferase [Candidatus Aminicenantes bacterium]|jgi:glucose-1-phosphate adenylyltransferase
MPLSKVITIILAGGHGSRLYPLTKKRSKPAVPIAGRFRLIDFPISNCIHSGLRRIFLLTQFSSESLHRHLFLTYRFDNFSKDFITILSASQTLESPDWYQGTADAVRQNLRFLRTEGEMVLILSGDHLYQMDYRKFIDFHLDKKAEVSISVYPVHTEMVPELGVMKVEENGKISEFHEKPKEPSLLMSTKVSETVFKRFGVEAAGRTHLASMGIYLFNWKVLNDMLSSTTYEDFGREVIPSALNKYKVYAYFFDGYWKDIGTIRSFFEAHLDLIQPLPQFNLYDEDKLIFSRARFLPGSKINHSEVQNSILCEGSIIDRARINQSIIGIRSRIGKNSVIERSVLMGADFFESEQEFSQNKADGIPDVGIGENCEIRNTIIDKNVRIGNGVKLVNSRNINDEDSEYYVIRDGIIVIPKNAAIPDGTVI